MKNLQTALKNRKIKDDHWPVLDLTVDSLEDTRFRTVSSSSLHWYVICWNQQVSLRDRRANYPYSKARIKKKIEEARRFGKRQDYNRKMWGTYHRCDLWQVHCNLFRVICLVQWKRNIRCIHNCNSNRKTQTTKWCNSCDFP